MWDLKKLFENVLILSHFPINNAATTIQKALLVSKIISMNIAFYVLSCQINWEYSSIFDKIMLTIINNFNYKASNYCYNAGPWKGTCIVNAYCQFSQQACTNFMQTYLYSLISTHLFILTTNLHCQIRCSEV